MATEPFTLIYTTIYEALRANAALTGLVNGGNWETFAGLTDGSDRTGQGIKTSITDVDTPDVVFIQGMGKGTPYWTSLATKWDRSYSILTTFANLGVVAVNAFEYATMQALLQLGPQLGLDGLVYKWGPIICNNTQNNQELQRGTLRYCQIIQIPVELYRQTNQL